jgi:hypothetical protein
MRKVRKVDIMLVLANGGRSWLNWHDWAIISGGSESYRETRTVSLDL